MHVVTEYTGWIKNSEQIWTSFLTGNTAVKFRHMVMLVFTELIVQMLSTSELVLAIQKYRNMQGNSKSKPPYPNRQKIWKNLRSQRFCVFSNMRRGKKSHLIGYIFNQLLWEILLSWLIFLCSMYRRNIVISVWKNSV